VIQRLVVFASSRHRFHFHFVVKATALKQANIKIVSTILSTEASYHIYTSQWTAINAKANLCAYNLWIIIVSDSSSAFGTLLDDLPPNQPFWDRPGMLADVGLAKVKPSLSSPAQLASFLAASSSHSGD